MATLTRTSNSELLRLPDCGGLLENGKCQWLTVPTCIGERCSYYQKINSFHKARERLRSLDEATQERIAKKYYGGLRPWEEPVGSSSQR